MTKIRMDRKELQKLKPSMCLYGYIVFIDTYIYGITRVIWIVAIFSNTILNSNTILKFNFCGHITKNIIMNANVCVN